LGEEPDPRRMPQTTSYPEEVQVAFFIYSFLPEKFEGMSGTYIGKEWTSCEFLFEVYEVEDRKTAIYFMKLLERLSVKKASKDAERKQKQKERRSMTDSGGKKYTHNVRG